MIRPPVGDAHTRRVRAVYSGISRAVRVAAALVSGVALVGAAAASSSPSAQATTISLLDDPLAKFAKLMPVFTHPRCLNCHGNTFPFTDIANNPYRNHSADQVDPVDSKTGVTLITSSNDHGPGDRNRPCLVCHDDPTAQLWHLAPKRMDFRGRDAYALCSQIRADTKFDTAEKFLHHLETDPLQVVAFTGRRGILPTSDGGDPAEPPPMTQLQFFETAEEWLKGHDKLPCSGWVGTVTQTETVNLQTVHPVVGGNTSQTESQIATRTTMITFGGPSGISAEISVSGSHGMETTITSATCTMTTRDVKAYKGNTSGTIQQASLTFGFAGGAYSLDITGPEEQTTTLEQITVLPCGAPSFTDTTSEPYSHQAWTIKIRGILPGSDRTFKKLEGTETETVTENDDRSWFLTRGPHVTPLQMRANGNFEPVPVTVTTTWNLGLEP